MALMAPGRFHDASRSCADAHGDMGGSEPVAELVPTLTGVEPSEARGREAHGGFAMRMGWLMRDCYLPRVRRPRSPGQLLVSLVHLPIAIAAARRLNQFYVFERLACFRQIHEMSANCDIGSPSFASRFACGTRWGVEVPSPAADAGRIPWSPFRSH